MATRRTNPRAVKLHRSYTVSALADLFGVHKNTVRQWQRDGLEPVDSRKPVLFGGATIRAFLTKRNASRKRPCPPGTLYCFRCRQPRPPALGMVDFVRQNATTGNIRAMCATCDAIMHRNARAPSLATIMPGYHVQILEASPRLNGRPSPSLNCDLERTER